MNKPALSRFDRRMINKLLLYALLIGLSLFMLLPLIFMVRSSLMTIRQIFAFPVQWVPSPVVFENYPEAFTTVPFLLYLKNTLVILVLSVAGTIITGTISAYGFSRLRWPGRDLVFGILISALMLPYAVTLIPTFLLWSRLDLTNTVAPLTVPSWFGGSIFFVFLLRQFFRTIPRELDEAAVIDGANPIEILWHVVVPLSRPALITVAIFAGLNAWNDFLGPLIYLTNSEQFTLALGLAQFTGLYTSQWHLLMAAATMVIAPVVLVFLVAQRYFVEGITLTGIKG